MILFSCATTQTKKAPNVPRGITAKEKILEYYRELRAKEWEKRQSKQKSKKYKAKRFKKKKSNYTEKKASPPPAPKIKWVDKDSQKIEIEQKLAYYCMKNRKNSKFSNENDCYAFTENIKLECSDKFQRGDARLTKCISTRIKN